jgi:TonB family protein
MLITLRIVSIMVLITSSLAVSVNKDARPASPSILKQQSQSRPDEDKVYLSREVTEKAVIKSRPEVQSNPIATEECPQEGSVLIKMVLHKSGKVKDVKLIRGMSCGFDRLATEASRRIKFVPAQKDGVRVSQYLTIEYAYKRYSY